MNTLNETEKQIELDISFLKKCCAYFSLLHHWRRFNKNECETRIIRNLKRMEFLPLLPTQVLQNKRRLYVQRSFRPVLQQKTCENIKNIIGFC